MDSYSRLVTRFSKFLFPGLFTLAEILIPSSVCFANNSDLENILFINSYHRGYVWSDDIEEGLRQRFRESGRAIDLSFEYLDSRRFAYGAQIPSIVNSMEVKYAGYRPKVVIVSDNAAFSFAVENRERLFPGVPIVFCGYNNFRAEYLNGISKITGINEEIDFVKSVEMALTVHPRTQTLVFILSTADLTNKNNTQVVEATVTQSFQNQYELVFLKDASLDKVRETLSELPKESLLFLSGQVSDQVAGRAMTPEENGRRIAEISPFPVYTFWDFHIGTGALGGRILKGHDQGSAAANLALKIMDGEHPDSIPVVMTSPVRNVFDHAMMRKFDLKMSDLPPESIVLNKTETVWEKYFLVIVSVFSVLLLQTVLLLALFHNIRLRQRAFETLKEERSGLEERVRIRSEELAKVNSLAAFAKDQDRAIEIERRRLAREVHDQIGQIFTAIKLIVDSLPQDTFVQGQAAAIRDALAMGIASTRRITAELRPPLLDDLGFNAAVTHFIQHHPGLNTMTTSIRITGDSHLDATQSLALFRILQEAVTNIVKHAKANELKIVGEVDNDYSLRVSDNGCGIEYSRVRPGALGLSSMRERASMLGGSLTITTDPVHGTSIEVRVPLHEARA